MNLKSFFIKCIFLSLTSSVCYGFNTSVTVQDINGKNAADIVVFLTPIEGQPVTKSNHQVIISQSHKTFSPYISVTQSGNPLIFSNRDDITHHIYSTGNEEAFAFTIKPGQEINQAVNKASEIAMGCNVHDWMSGHLMVLDTPYFTKTASNGKAVLATQLPGKYQLTLWHPQLLNATNRQSLPISINSDQNITVKLRSKMARIPEQKSSGDFDFLSDY